MKTIFIAHSWTDVSVNIQTKEVAKRLSEKFNVIFFTQARIGQKEIKINNNLTIKEWPHKRPSKLADIFFLLKNIFKYHPQTIIVHFGATNMVMLVAFFLRIKNRVCWLHTLSGQIFLDVKNTKDALTILNKRIRAYKRATNVVVLNSAGYTDAIKNYKIQEKKIKLIYNGIKDPLEKNYIKDNNLVFSYLGRLDHSKGVDILLNAFKMVLQKYPTACLVLAGKGDEEISLKNLSKELNIDYAVKFAGWISDYKQVFEYFKQAYTLIVPSRLDNFPTVVLEAMACKTPVIAAKVGGIPDMIKEAEGGYLFEKENAEELAQKIMLLAGNPTLWQEQCNKARERFLQNFSMQKHITEVEQYITSLNN